MNIICDLLPNTINIDGKDYEIKTDFKVWLRFHSIMTNENISGYKKIVLAIACCFDVEKCKILPPDAEKTINALLKFYANEKKEQKESKSCKIRDTKKLFDFEEDANYIYSAFLMEYGIDLSISCMHWYKFLALFEGLTDRTQFIKIVSYRNVNLEDIGDIKKRDAYRRLKNAYALKKDNKPLAEGDVAQRLASIF